MLTADSFDDLSFPPSIVLVRPLLHSQLPAHQLHRRLADADLGRRDLEALVEVLGKALEGDLDGLVGLEEGLP